MLTMGSKDRGVLSLSSARSGSRHHRALLSSKQSGAQQTVLPCLQNTCSVRHVIGIRTLRTENCCALQVVLPWMTRALK